MTQEIILGVLLVGIIGLIWALTFANVSDDHHARDHHQDSGAHHPSKSDASDDSSLPHRKLA